MSDILTRLLLNTSDYDSKLKKAKGSTEEFASAITGKVLNSAMKLAGAFAAVAGAASTFEGVIKGSQTTSDEFDRVIRSVKSSVESFFTALSTGDFTTFNMGIDAMIQKARSANDALDQLWNTTTSYNYFNTRYQAEFAEAITTLRDKNATKEEKAAAKATADMLLGKQSEITEQLRLRTSKAIGSLVSEKNTLGLNMISRVDIDDILALDVSAMGDKFKEELSKMYKEYEKIYNNAYARNERLVPTSELGKFERVVDYKALEAEMQGITETYKLAILYNEILVRNSDEWLSKLVNIQQTSDNAVRTMANMERQLNRASQSASDGGKSNNGKAKKGLEIPVYVGFSRYGTDLGQKVLKWMNGEDVPVIKTEIEIDEQVDEEDLSGKWGEHIKKIEDMNNALAHTGDIFGSLGDIMGSFGNDMGAWMLGTMGEIAGMIVQLQSLATANGVTSASKLPFPANIAAIATVVATIASVFSSLPKFADGGIVGGSSYFGDKLLARVNSGEMILNQSQQSRLFNMMDGGNVRVSGDVRLNGKDIYISLRNYMSSSGNRL